MYKYFYTQTQFAYFPLWSQISQPAIVSEPIVWLYRLISQPKNALNLIHYKKRKQEKFASVPVKIDQPKNGIKYFF